MTIKIVDLPINHGGSFHSYVSLPEGISTNIPFFLVDEKTHGFNMKNPINHGESFHRYAGYAMLVCQRIAHPIPKYSTHPLDGPNGTWEFPTSAMVSLSGCLINECGKGLLLLYIILLLLSY